MSCTNSNIVISEDSLVALWSDEATQVFLQIKDELKVNKTKDLNQWPLDYDIKWYLRDNDFQKDVTIKKLTQTKDVRKEYRVDDIVKGEVNFDKSVILKAHLEDYLDKFSRPVIYVYAGRHKKGKKQQNFQTQQYSFYIIEKALQKASASGQEYVVAIVDCEGYSLENVDVPIAMFMKDMFFQYYPKKVAKVFVINYPTLALQTWNNFIKPFFGQYKDLVIFTTMEHFNQYYRDLEDSK